MASSRASQALQFDFSVPPEATSEPQGEDPVQQPGASPGRSPGRSPGERPGEQPGGVDIEAGGGDRASEGQATDSADQAAVARRPAVVVAKSDTAGARSLQAGRPGTSADAALTVAQFYDRVKAALRLEFPTEVWVTGEIRKVSISKGNHYLELADHDAQHDAEPGRATSATNTTSATRATNTTSAMLDVACWSRDWHAIGAELASVGIELSAGLVVKIRGRVGIWDGAAKLRFSMTALDVEALLGGIAAARRKLLLALEQEDLLAANRRLAKPLVPMRIGLVTSAGSEAHRDFAGQLDRSGYAFEIMLESCLVQGVDAPGQIAAAIARLHVFEPDLIVLVRGGGGRGDLAAFDSEVVARAIATSSYPVWTGIGHTGDRSVADEVSQRALITPTACGEAIVTTVATYLEGVDGAARTIAARGRAELERAVDRVEEARGRLSAVSRHQLDRATSSLLLASSRAVHSAVVGLERNRATLSGRSRDLGRICRYALSDKEQSLSHLRAVLEGFDPKRQLARGWSLTKNGDGRVLRSVAEVSCGEGIVTVLADGTVASSVENVSRVEETA